MADKDKDSNEYEEHEDESEKSNLVHIEIYSKIFHVDLSDEINSPGKYKKFAAQLRSVGPNDQVVVHLNNFGGDCHGGVLVANQILSIAAPVITVIESPCYSMASLIALCGTSLCLKPDTFLMFHNYSGITVGKGSEALLSSSETERWLRGFFRNRAFPFLSKKELDAVSNDKDVYIHWDDPTLKDRMLRHFGEATLYPSIQRKKKVGKK